MGGSHPEIALDELIHLAKGFVDMLVLASGHQSSGLKASWDSANVKNAVRWGQVLEDLLEHFGATDNRNDSMKSLDSALIEVTSHPQFPSGLTEFSSTTLARARHTMLERLVQALNLKETHLDAILNAVVELDLEYLTKSEDGSVDLYLENLIVQANSFDKDFPRNSIDRNARSTANNAGFILLELLKRKTAISRLYSAETSIGILREVVAGNISSGLELHCPKTFGSSTSPWSHWNAKSLDYLLHQRTIRLLSGVKLIFASPKDQWLHVLESLRVATGDAETLLELIEMVLIYLASDRWGSVMSPFMRSWIDPCMANQCGVHDFFHQFWFQNLKGEILDREKGEVMEYLSVLLASRTDLLWKLPPVLVAASLPLWSVMFKMYLSDIESLLNGQASSIQCCNCIEQGETHSSCEVAERSWCLCVIHSQGVDSIDKFAFDN